MQWRCRARTLQWGLHDPALIMGVVNVTPDSFSDGGQFVDPAAAVAHGLRLVEAGATLLDIGGESSRPGAAPVSAADEAARVLPVIEGLRSGCDALLSVDTCKAEVAEAAIAAGADVINDIRGLRDPEMRALAARSSVGLVAMHMRGTPQTMQAGDLSAEDRVGEVVGWAQGLLAGFEAEGIDPLRVCLDPGIGFGKTAAQSAALIAQLPRLLALGRPVLVGASRKSFLGAVTGRAIEAREAATVAAHAVAAFLGAHVVRAHVVEAAVDGARVAAALRAAL